MRSNAVIALLFFAIAGHAAVAGADGCKPLLFGLKNPLAVLEKDAEVTVELLPFRQDIVAGEPWHIVGEVRNLSKRVVWIAQETSRLDVPAELWGMRTRGWEVCGRTFPPNLSSGSIREPTMRLVGSSTPLDIYLTKRKTLITRKLYWKFRPE
jgi:hypothetical protein